MLDGPINCDAFRAYVARVPVPELGPGELVVMDNLGSHKGPAARGAIEAAGARLLFLLPGSPITRGNDHMLINHAGHLGGPDTLATRAFKNRASTCGNRGGTRPGLNVRLLGGLVRRCGPAAALQFSARGADGSPGMSGPVPTKITSDGSAAR